MRTTRIFKSGNSMAVRLPNDFRLHGNEVAISMVGNKIVISEIPTNLSDAFTFLTDLPDDFFASGRTDTAPQNREFF